MSKEKKFGTFIHGIAASEHLDSSGERIIVEGVDISSLTKDGVFNFEHQSKEASHIVGKILEAKKIFKKSDCENDSHKYFWDKVKMPFVYVAGELFDHVGHGAAQDVAAMLKYDKNLNKDETKALVNFSIEGSRLAKDGSNITKCIARKVSITITPCNKMAHAEHMEKPTESKKDDSIDISKEILSKFKKSEEIAIEIIAKNDVLNFKPKKKPFTSMKVGNQESAPAKTSFTPKRTFSPENAPKDMQIGDRIKYEKKPRHKPKTGKDIYSNPDTWKSENKKVKKGSVHGIKTGQEVIDNKGNRKINPETGTNFLLPSELSEGAQKLYRQRVREKNDKRKKSKLGKYDSNVRKAITASCGAGSPSSKTQGAALEKKNILKHLADETWKDYDKKNELVNFLTEKYPSMDKSEVMALAKTYVYIDLKKKEIALEKAHVKKDVSEKDKKLESSESLAASEDEKNVEEMNIDLKKEKPFHGYNKKKHSKKGGLSESYRKKYNRQTGSNLKAPVSSKAAKESPKKAARRKSFCARMSGVKGATSKDGKLTPKGAALKRGDC
jgi:hypothetical protein